MSNSVFIEAITNILEDLGDDATYKGQTVKVNFEHGTVVINGIETRAPIAECSNADISGVRHGDTITINSVAYKVIGIEASKYTTRLILSGDSHG